MTAKMTDQLGRALGFPRRYAGALQEARRFRAMPARMEFGEAYGVARQIGMTQKRDEIQWLFERVCELQPRTVLEIGLNLGGTFFLWSRAASPDAHLLAIDTSRPGVLGARSAFPMVRHSFAADNQRISLLLGRDSHERATFDRVRRLVGGSTIDFLFIDGDHSYGGVSADFNTYSPLVRSGGLVAFHDVSQDPTPDTEGTARFWREFTVDHDTDECVAGGEPGYGIGLYPVPSRSV
jgi:predicted O-methyltransferase YrrM